MKWYACRTRPSHEARVAKELTAAGVDVLHLRYKARSIRKDRVDWVEASHFPCYLFIYVKPWQLRLAPKAGAQVVAFAGQPTPIPSYVMDVLRAGADQTGLITMSKDKLKRARYQAMQEVEFTSGAFSGEVAKVIADDGTNTIKLLVKILGGWQKIAAPVHHIRAA